ncbi:glycoside hydrolase family 20 protein [Capnocytophaga leadbetteri]|uniref:glycoside hydrolase family 20 protein n=1 Tax=Capnocytophaga leadbetteri TaxID=327575 RepID=UPI0028E2C2C0|nr:glycoside hydrolase family 20 protein [Capnocytophaga leadbetteri]
MKTMKKLLYLSVLLCLTACHPPKKEVVFTSDDLTIIPQPQSMVLGKGYFQFTQETVFVIDPTLMPARLPFLNQFERASGFKFAVQKVALSGSSVVIDTDKSLPKEGYTLTVTPKQISIKAADYNGALYALQTLRQLLPNEVESSELVKRDWLVPAVTITDAPQYQWRGLMLDVSRHFFPKEYILKTLDRMAMLKLNTFHFHLVDNEGWRIEIKKYPKLTEVGAWRVDQEDKLWDERTPNPANAFANPATAPKKYGGFYTQEDIKEIVAYATARGITVIPEIEMPAHAMSAIAAYPELSCHKRPIGVPSGAVWPITDIYCAGQEETFDFIEEVLTEVLALFPSQYIHVGGDEATHTEWERCPKCQLRMKEHQLKNVHQLQSYFIRRIDDFLTSKGRTLVGWDEIMDGGLAKNAVVMNWRGIEVGKKALAQGNPIVLTSDCYIDNYQGLPDYEPQANGGYLPLKKLYNYNLEKEALSDASLEKSKVLGTQANLWAEHVGSTEHSEYMLFPRLLALAEISWTNDKLKDWDSFMRRTQHFMQRMDVMGIHYARSVYQVVPTVENKEGSIYLKLECEVPNADIRYALGDTPIEKGEKYTAPIAIKATTTYKAAVFSANATNTITSGQITFHKAIGKPVSYSPLYHKSYQGQGEGTLTNVIRGTKNFHDGQWLGWLGDDVTLTLDLGETTEVSEVRIGAMDAQSSGIYFPERLTVALSADGKNYREVAAQEEPCTIKGKPSLKDFVLKFDPQSTRYLQIQLKNVKTPPKGGDAWLFIDEILVL